ncbi:fungal-specific transcription factor domain-domain-containing protein [Clohesyomyces aquaticus]|uniref:Fungal-specific transcription factor domain-domain-containing protein n=1 Tax=Clohesyomyces aquaticus TaxID=1231657 RepID=A0A1Y1ZF69_9PLEO|nr:fungal-specific transcription factor domain-domain-containing protein [Clohesyomyces aquaticus]
MQEEPTALSLRRDYGSWKVQARLIYPLGISAAATANTTDDAAEPPAPDDVPPIPLEAPPSGPAYFSWDEQSQEMSPEADAQTLFSQGEDERVVDGMASLTVDESEVGYLGVASGAAMLRLLLPDAQQKRNPMHAAGLSSRPPTSNPTSQSMQQHHHWLETPLWDSLNIGAIDLDFAIDAYFCLFHQSYPMVHEPTFRAQYAQVIPRPSGRSWHALAFMIAAMGIFTVGTGPTGTDRHLFTAAKSNISIESLETGNITLVLTLTLMSNYLQKRNKPNSEYNYLGLALHMAMGLGLHKEFHDWDISPLNMEIRRRVWFCMFVFNIGAAITFGRPLAWPNKNVEVSLPLNVSDRSLTNLSWTVPTEADHVTTYSSVIMQSRFHTLANDIYTRVISMPFPSATELLHLDDSLIRRWESSVAWYREDANVLPLFATGHGIMWWRMRNFRIIMYRPYVMRRALQARSQPQDATKTFPPAVQEAYDRCVREAKLSINSISEFLVSHAPTRLAAWYALYFIFQASLIPCVCLRNEPTSPLAPSWRSQILQTLRTIQLISPVNPSAQDCYEVIQRLCGPFLHPNPNLPTSTDERNNFNTDTETTQTGTEGVTSYVSSGPN